MFDLAQIETCIHQVHPTTIAQVIKVESSKKPLALNVNALPGKAPPKFKQPKTKQQAVELANYYISLGHSVDLGLMQVNSNNLRAYGVTVGDMFEPCKNVSVGSKILFNAYQRALKINANPGKALGIALSYYNTGSPTRGFKNGYVKKYGGHDPSREKAVVSNTKIEVKGLYD